MDKKRIGLNYNVSTSWIGGKYYLDSIISELQKNSNVEIVYLKKNIFIRIIEKVFGHESRVYKYMFKKINNLLKLDIVFPTVAGEFSAQKKIFWIPDFQESYYPEFFSVEEIVYRLSLRARIAYSHDYLVLSSESAKNDFEKIFPKYTCNVIVFRFISSLASTNINFISSKVILEKYNIKAQYFICSNQLWKHKNHMVIIKAIELLKQKGINLLCVFTGQEEDYRNKDYPMSIKNFVKNNNLSDNIKFLGFIPRIDQISLIKYSLAVIQPSLFEGWNTTIEDAKVLNKPVIASSLPVHLEQLKEKGTYFSVDDYRKLSDILYEHCTTKTNNIDYNYSEQIKEYCDKITEIFC